MARKKAAVAETTPKDVLGKWQAEDAPVELRVKRAASSLAWYRAALKGRGLKDETRAKYERQAERYGALVAELRAERDAAKGKGASS